MSLFGQNPAQPSAFGGGGGLFGQPQPQQQQTSAFGQPAGQPTGGLFGAQPASTGAFGGLGAQSQAPGLGGGLFGQPKPAGAPATSQFGGFGQPAPGAQPASGGLFGQTSQSQPFSQGLQGTGGQPAAGGLFGNPSASAPGQTSAFGGVGGGFGSIAQTSTSSFTGQQPATSAFGSTSPTFGGAGGSGGTGLFGGAQQSQSAFGGLGAQSQGAFGQPKPPSLFGAPAAGQQPGASAFGGGFSQATSSAPTGGLFSGATQQQQPGLANQTFGAPAFGQPQQQQQPGMGLGMNPGAQGDGLYQNAQAYQQQVSSVGYQFQPAFESVQDAKVKEQVPNLYIQNIKGHAQFKYLSNEMLRLLDLKQSKGQPQPSYEFSAMNEFNQNQQKYALLQQSKSIRQSANGALPGQAAPSSFGNPNPQQQQQTGLFGQPQQPAAQSSFGQPGTGLFGQPTAQSTAPLGGGLFAAQQQQPQNQPTSLFGPSGQQQPAQQTGLFGQTQPAQASQPSAFGVQPSQPGGLFGQAPAQPGQAATQSLFGPKPGGQTGPAGSGLFSQQSATTPGQQPGSIFGQPQQKPATTSLFSQPAQQSTGLFGQPSAQKPGGLFGPTSTAGTGFTGQPAQQPSGLFGPSQPQAQPQSSLFGVTQTQQPQGSALFGPQTPQTQTASLFGPKPAGQQTTSLFGPQTGATQQPSTSLFGPQQTAPFQQQYQQMAPQQAGFNPMNVYQSQDPFGLSAGFMSKVPDSVEAIQKELEAIRKNVASARSAYDTKAGSSTQPGEFKADDFETTPGGLTAYHIPEISLGIDHSQKLRDASRAEERRLQEKQDLKYGVKSEIFKSEMQAMRKSVQEQDHGSQFGYRDLSKRKRVEDALAPSTSSYSRQSYFERQLLKPKQETSRIPDLGNNTSMLNSVSDWVSNALSRDQSMVSESTIRKMPKPNDVIEVTLILRANDKYDMQQIKVQIHNSRDIRDLQTRASDWLAQNFKFDPSGDTEVMLCFNNRILDLNKTIKEEGVSDEAKLYVQLHGKDDSKAVEAKAAESEKEEAQKVMPAANQIPKAPKQGDKVHPSMESLQNMTLSQLQAVEDLKVHNDFGSVEWIGKTDVTGVDFADLVTIQQNVAEVYDDERHIQTKPIVGQKLNKPAYITLNGMKPTKPGQTAAKFEERLIKSLTKNPDGAEHLSYDSEKGIWQFKVNHFTKWGVDDDSDEEAGETKEDASQPIVPAKEEAKAVQPADQPVYDTILPQQRVHDEQMLAAEAPEPPMTQSIRKRQRVEGKQMRLETESARDSEIIDIPVAVANAHKAEVENRIFSTHVAKRDKAERVMESIRRKEAAFKKVSPLTCQKPSDKETMHFLQKLSIKSGLAKTSLRSGITRPCFSPDGSIAFVSGNKIRVVPTAPVAACKEFSTASTVLKHSQVERKQEQELGAQMSRMNLAEQQPVALQTGAQSAQRMLFEDQFFLGMLTRDLPKVGFCSAASLSDQVQLSQFLYDQAKEMAAECKAAERKSIELGDRVKHEFITVCLLNALFGNPRLNLVQLHSAFKGPKTLEREKALYGLLETDAEGSLVTLKQRANALVEVLRFHSSQVHKVTLCPPRGANDDQIYTTALQMINNGDIRGAVKHFQAQKKCRFAMIIARSVNQPHSMQVLAQHMQNVGQGAQRTFREICAFITGQPCANLSWDQELLQNLLFSQDKSRSLIDLVKQKEQSQNFKATESILWSLCKIYAGCKNADKSFEQFSKQLTPSCSQRDYRLRWVVQLVLNQVLHNRHTSMMDDVGKDALIDEPFFVAVTCQYVRQLMSAGDWQSALTVSLMVPQQYTAIRNKLVFQVISLQARSLITQAKDQKRDISFISQQLSLPVEWSKAAQALCLQSVNLYESAIAKWLEAGNVRQAHTIWYDKILPLYMTRGCGVELVKALQLSSTKLLRAERTQLIRAQQICLRGEQVDMTVNEFAARAALIADWETKTGNFKKFLELLRNLAEKGCSSGEVCRSFTDSIKKIQAFSRDFEASDPVDRFISQEIASISNFLQMREDEENLKEGRERTGGVAHFTGAANEYKLQSDSSMVVQNRPRVAREAEQLIVSQLLNRVGAASQ